MRPSRVAVVGSCVIAGWVNTAEVHAEPLATGVGVAVLVGGGVEQLVSADGRATIGPAALWETRAVLGTRLPLSTEVAYLGTVSTLERAGEPRATLVSSGVELLLRVNLSRSSRWRPYLFTGRAVRHYAVSGVGAAKAAGMAHGHDRDVVLDLPIGGGFMVLARGLVFDGRVAFRASTGSELLALDDPAPGDSRYAETHSWSATARIGFEL